MKMLEQWWKRKFCVEPGEGGEGGSGGGGGTAVEGGAPAGGEEGTKAGEGEHKPEGGNEGGKSEPQIPSDVQQELERLKQFERKASAHLEVDPTTGEYRPKKVVEAPIPKFTQEQLEQMQLENSIAEKSANLIEQNRKAETATIDKYKVKDPLFAQNIVKAREKIMGLPAAQRTEAVWDRAYSMAMGETMAGGSYEKHYIEQGKQQALKELSEAEGVTLPRGTGAGTGGSGSKIDVSKIRLSPEQRDVAIKMINQGLIESIDDYKRNAFELGSVEEG